MNKTLAVGILAGALTACGAPAPRAIVPPPTHAPTFTASPSGSTPVLASTVTPPAASVPADARLLILTPLGEARPLPAKIFGASPRH